MAIARLKKGMAAWNTWRDEKPKIHPDLERAYLSKANLSKANQANLSRANLLMSLAGRWMR